MNIIIGIFSGVVAMYLTVSKEKSYHIGWEHMAAEFVHKTPS